MGFLFGSRERPQAPTPVARMPVPGEQNRAAAAETRRRLLTRRGRSSTIMSGRSSEAGTTSYGNSLLGQAG